MASLSIPDVKCEMYGCPHLGQSLSSVVRPSGCVFDCTVPTCEGCARDLVKATGEFKCPYCKQVSSSFSCNKRISVMDIHKKNHLEARKQLKRAGGAGAAAAAAAADDQEWEVDGIIGVQKHGDCVYYKVVWTERLSKKHFRWIDVESNCAWTEKENLVENCSLLLAEFDKKWGIPKSLADGYYFNIVAPPVRMDRVTEKRVYGCAHLSCEKEFQKKDAAMKHAHSAEHWDPSNTNKSPFPCSLCNLKFFQKSSRDRHCKEYHVVQFSKDELALWELELDGDEWEAAKVKHAEERMDVGE